MDGTNGAAGENSIVVPAVLQVPWTDGDSVGVGPLARTRVEKATLTVASEGTSVAPAAGVVETTEGVGCTACVEVLCAVVETLQWVRAQRWRAAAPVEEAAMPAPIAATMTNALTPPITMGSLRRPLSIEPELPW